MEGQEIEKDNDDDDAADDDNEEEREEERERSLVNENDVDEGEIYKKGILSEEDVKAIRTLYELVNDDFEKGIEVTECSEVFQEIENDAQQNETQSRYTFEDSKALASVYTICWNFKGFY